LVTAVEMVVQMAGAPTFFGPSFSKKPFCCEIAEPAQVLSKPHDPCGGGLSEYRPVRGSSRTADPCILATNRSVV
jgi:hypothetical protein